MLRTINLILTATLFVLAAGPAHAGFVGAVVSWFGSLSFASGIAGALARLAVGIGFNLLSTAIAKKFAKRQAIDVKFDIELGDDRPLSFTVGAFATAGKRKYIGSWGPNTRFITEVIEVSCLPQPGQPGLWVNDTHAEIDWASTGTHSETVITGYTTYTTDNGHTRRRPIYARKTVTMGHPVTNYAGGVQKIWVKWVAGPTEADPFLVDVFGDDPDYPWTAEMIGTGKSYLIVTTQYDSDVITSYPQYLIEPPPLPMYDPRKDSTVGGVGAHRWGDRSTYEPSFNNAVIAYNIARGIYLGDEWIFGGRNLSAWRLPLAEWIAAMNACDEEVELAEGGTEPAYRCGAEISVDMEPLGVLEEIGRAANMRFAEVGGRLKPIVGLPGASVYTITDADIIITEGQSLTPFLPEAQTYNALTATYPEPAEKWASKPAPEYVDAEATAADDGDYLPVGVTYGAAPFAQQVQRLMRAQMRDYRRMAIAQFQLPPDAFGLEPLVDMITWNSARNGFSGKRFVVESIAKLAGMNVAVTLREVDPGDYDWSPAWERPVVIAPPVNVIPVVLEPEDFAAVGVAVQSEDGRDRLPGIQCSCAGGLSGVAAVRIQVRKIAAAEPMLDVERPYAEPHEWVVTGVAPETTYFVRLALVSDFGVPAEWSDEIEVVTPQILIDFPDLAPDVEGAMEDALAAAALAEAAEAGAQAAQTASETARNLSQAAATAAADARDAANSAAALALASETAASGSATAAATAKTASEAAKTAAETARNQAQTAATNAGNSASAAAGSAATASTKATEAGNSAAAAQASVVAAEAAQTAAVGAVAASFPEDFSEKGAFWVRNEPSGFDPAPVPDSYFRTSAVGGEPVFWAVGPTISVLGPRAFLPATPGRRYELTVRFRVTVNSTVTGGTKERAALEFRGYAADGAALSVGVGLAHRDTCRVADGVMTLTTAYTVPASPSFALLRPRFYLGYDASGNGNATYEVISYAVRDVTESTNAAASATAAATSASSAAASATDAGESASAASTSATAATTKAGEASTSATNAANSASTATTKANEASSSATVAATQAGNAGASASAASGSANTAATKATEAGNSATAAAASATTASTKAGEASTSATQAASSATTAQGHASSASTSATTAASARDSALRTAAELLPSSFDRDGLFWTHNLGGEPVARMSSSLLPVVTFGTDSAEGRYAQVDSPHTNNIHIATKGYVPGVVGRRYRLTVRAMHVGAFAGNSDKALSFNMRRVTSTWANGGDFASANATFTAPDTWQTFVLEGVFSGSAPWFVPFAYVVGANFGGATGRSIRVSMIKCEDVTESTNATESATAASTSETNAAASATTAGAQATIATTKATEASTSAGTASTKAGEAASSATSAAGSANTAATHASVAASTLDATRLALASSTAISGKASTATLPFGYSIGGTVEAFTPYTAASYASDADGVYLARSQEAAYSNTMLRGVVPSVDGKVYRLRVRFKSTHANDFQFVLGFMDGSGTLLTGSLGFETITAAANSMTEATMVFGRQAGGLVTRVVRTQADWDTAVSIRVGIGNKATGIAGAVTRIYEIAVDDLTEADLAARQATLSAGSAAAAATSATTATTKANEAGQYSAEAMEYRNTAARLMSGGVSKNPVFNDWTGTYPEHVACAPLGAGTITKVTSGARYINAIEVDANVSSVNGPLVRLERVAHGLDCSASPRAVLARMEIEYVSGDLPGSGGFLRGYWQDTATRVVDRPLKDLITATPGVVQVVETYIERPADAVPGSAADFMLVFYGHTTLHGGTRAPLKVRIHRLDFEEVLAGSATETWQRAAVDFQGVQSALVGFRVNTDGAEALLELVAFADPTGSASIARIAADQILLEGSVTIEYLDVDFLRGGRILAEYLDIETQLTILPGGALAYGKTSVQDEVDGIYFGRDADTFGFAASRTTAAFSSQSIRLSETTGLELRNARHYVSAPVAPVTVQVTASAAKTALPAGTTSITVEGIGGGAAGRSSRQLSTTVGDREYWDGGSGGDTIVRLYDGSTLVETLTFPGAGSTYPAEYGLPISECKGRASAYAAGGWYRTAQSTGPGQAGSKGSGGGGGRSNFYSTYAIGYGGRAAAQHAHPAIDLSGYADPQIEVIIGAGGAPHNPGGSNVGLGGTGGGGYVKYTYSSIEQIPADVIPLKPTATGTVSATATLQSFPDLGPGMWQVNVVSSTPSNGASIYYESTGSTLGPDRMELTGMTAATFFSRTVPRHVRIAGNTPIHYRFYAMTTWGG